MDSRDISIASLLYLWLGRYYMFSEDMVDISMKGCSLIGWKSFAYAYAHMSPQDMTAI